MKVLKWVSVCLLSLVFLSGCFGKKPGSGLESGYLTDTPLPELRYDEFMEPTGPDSYLFNDIHFDYDSYEIRWEDRETLGAIVEWMKSNDAKRLLVEGHCDERGTNEYNLALGEQRALAARQYVVDQGINPYRIQTISYGEEKPVDPGHDDGAWRQNRRSHFLIAG